MLLFSQGRAEEVEARSPRADEVVWLHLTAPSDDEIRRLVKDEFGCHPLAVDDIIHFNQRPKLVHYNMSETPHAFITFYSLDKQMSATEFCVVISQHYIITVVKTELDWLQALYNQAPASADEPVHTGALLHRILDQCVDRYFLLMDTLEDRMDHLERQVFNHPRVNQAPAIFRAKRRLHRARRVASEGRNVLGLLTHDAFPFTDDKDVVYYLDVYDHISRVVDGFDAIRDGLSGLLDLQTAQRANRMNEIMKTLAIISTIFLPMSFIVGLYGMNFKYIPELQWSFGYLYVWGLLISVVVGFGVYFKKRGWW